MENLVMINAKRIDPQFWCGRRVFLTGFTGFKGSWLALWLWRMGARVTGYSLLNKEPSLYSLAKISDFVESQTIDDVTNFDALNQAIKTAQPEVVFHLAAQPLVRYSYDNPIETYNTNVMGTAHVLEAVRNAPSVRAVVNVTTDKCYSNREWAWGYREDESLGGSDPYSSSKACSELITAAYRSSYFPREGYDRHGIALASARAGNVLGGGDFAKDRLVPDAIYAFSTGKMLRIRNPDSVRPWQHVLDAIHGYLLLAERLAVDGPDFGEAWNFGPPDYDSKTVQWLVEVLAGYWKPTGRWEVDKGPHAHEAKILRLDSTKARQRLGWNPIIDLSTSLDWTAEWALQYAAGRDMAAVTLAQIDRYQERLASQIRN